VAPPAGPDHVAAIWAVGDSDTVERDSTAPAAPSSVWDGSRIKLFGGRNEIVAFQLIVRATGDGIAAIEAGLPALTRRGGSETITYAPPAIVPRVYSAAGATVSFPEEAAPYEAGRLKLGRALASCPAK
jgi:hypothetical protein